MAIQTYTIKIDETDLSSFQAFSKPSAGVDDLLFLKSRSVFFTVFDVTEGLDEVTTD